MNHKEYREQKNHEEQNHKDHKDHKDETHDPIDPAVEQVVREVIGSAIAVHRQLGPGFLEPVYDRALCVELECRGLRVERQKCIDVYYRGVLICQHRLDLVAEKSVIVEVKAVREIRPIHQAQMLSYLKASGLRVGLLMNFNVKLFVDGLHRFVR
jgi:GxxExxY protein